MELLTWHDFITQNKAFNLVVDAAREIFVAFHLANSGSPRGGDPLQMDLSCKTLCKAKSIGSLSLCQYWLLGLLGCEMLEGALKKQPAVIKGNLNALKQLG
jgi:hypothetical protein